jgi:hypothetical protein
MGLMQPESLVDPRPWIDAREDVSASFDPEEIGVDDSAAAGVLSVLSRVPPWWETTAIAVGLARSVAGSAFGRYTWYSWLRYIADGYEVARDYAAYFDLDPEPLPHNARVLQRVFSSDGLGEAGWLLGIRHDVCRAECSTDGTLDPACYRRCILEAL